MTLDDPVGAGSYAFGVDGSNVTGFYFDPSNLSHGFLAPVPETHVLLGDCGNGVVDGSDYTVWRDSLG